MKTLQEMKDEHKQEVAEYRLFVNQTVRERLEPRKSVIGAMVSGSVARGDARRGAFGLAIDLVVVVENRKDIDLDKVFGLNEEPDIPYHCVTIDKQGMQIELTTMEELNNIRSRRESAVFAKWESDIVLDPSGQLRVWKNTAFIITDDQERDRALDQFFRFGYCSGDYRFEKWAYRGAWTQLAQIANEATECYCNFLFCINGWFIPRKDWLVYFTYELPVKCPEHDSAIDRLYTGGTTEAEIRNKFKLLGEIQVWMKEYCIGKNWLTD